MNQSRIIYLESGQKVAKLEGEKARPGQPRKLDLLLNPVGRWRLHGRIPRTEAQILEDFWARLKVNPQTQCWEWTGSKSKKGYGYLKFGASNVTAHRLAWATTHGKIPQGLFVCHKCDNPPCCNPDHLFLGTAQDNVNDAKRKGRIIVGTQRKFSKLNDDLIRVIRSESLSMSQADIARKHSINPRRVWDIVNYVSWKHVS